MAKKKTNPATEIDVLRLQQGRVTCYIRGASPLIYNALSTHAAKDLLYPEKKTAAEKAATPKHNPPEEYRRSVYRARSGPTVLAFPAVAFKRALASSALDLGGAKRTQIERLTWAEGERVSVYGVPMLRMDIIKQAGMTGAPDVRTRACLEEWCCKLELSFMRPAINETTVVNLLAAAGMIRGVGDFRQEKGAGNYGQFELVNEDDPDWHRIAKTGARAAQAKALENPEFWDEDTAYLVEWWQSEYIRRGHDKSAEAKTKKPRRKSKGNGAASVTA